MEFGIEMISKITELYILCGSIQIPAEKDGLTLFSMGYFKNTTVWGGAIMAPPCNFAVS